MKTLKFLPAGFAALVLIGAGAMVATAQTTTPEPSEKPMMHEPPHKSDRPHHGKRHFMRGGFGHGGGGQMFHELFETVDADKDGAVTRDEIDSYRTARISEADASGDGALSIEEFDTLYREFTRSRMVDAFQELDQDGDGAISAEELDSRVNRIVERLDRDGDGTISLKRERKGG